MNRNSKNKGLALLFSLLWLTSYFFFYQQFSVVSLLVPIIPLFFALFFGKQSMQKKHLAILVLLVFAVLLIDPIRTMIDAKIEIQDNQNSEVGQSLMLSFFSLVHITYVSVLLCLSIIFIFFKNKG